MQGEPVVPHVRETRGRVPGGHTVAGSEAVLCVSVGVHGRHAADHRGADDLKAKEGDTRAKLQRILGFGFEGISLDMTGLEQEKGSAIIRSLGGLPVLSVIADYEVPEGVKQTRVFTLGEMAPGFNVNEVIDIRIPEGLSTEQIREAMKDLPLSNTMILHTKDASRLINGARDITDKSCSHPCLIP
jgi:hypothetical protein